MSTENYTFRMSDEDRSWLERNGQPKAAQLRRDLEALQVLISLARRDEKRNHKLRDTLESFGLI